MGFEHYWIHFSVTKCENLSFLTIKYCTSSATITITVHATFPAESPFFKEQRVGVVFHIDGNVVPIETSNHQKGSCPDVVGNTDFISVRLLQWVSYLPCIEGMRNCQWMWCGSSRKCAGHAQSQSNSPCTTTKKQHKGMQQWKSRRFIRGGLIRHNWK